MDFLYGLDNLKRHRCCIDLANNKLIFDGGIAEVPFLQPEQIEEDKKMEVEGETALS